jgi:tripartite-type tricarboxylate transporter receptor subunit TctC
MKNFILTTAIASVLAIPAYAEGYYSGKTITYIIATSPGGGYDAYGRLIGQNLGEKLGASKVLFKNLPGAGHIIGANTLYAAKPDGLTIGTFNTGLIYAQILNQPG